MPTSSRTASPPPVHTPPTPCVRTCAIGPKLRGEHSTAHTGGGFRYDGLYLVRKAEMVPKGAAGLLTAMFTLQRQELRSKLLR